MPTATVRFCLHPYNDRHPVLVAAVLVVVMFTLCIFTTLAMAAVSWALLGIAAGRPVTSALFASTGFFIVSVWLAYGVVCTYRAAEAHIGRYVGAWAEARRVTIPDDLDGLTGA
jgi:hypothetical protein